MTDVVESLMQQVSRGRTLTVKMPNPDSRLIIATTRSKRPCLELKLTKPDYDQAMAEFMRALADRTDMRVVTNADHHGWWIRVKSGWLGHRVSRLFVSRRHFELLESEMRAKLGEHAHGASGGLSGLGPFQMGASIASGIRRRRLRGPRQ